MGTCSSPHGGRGDLPGESGRGSRHFAEPNGPHREHAEPGCDPHSENSSTHGCLNQSCDWWTLHAGDIDCDEASNFKAVHDLGHDSDVVRFRRLVNQYSQELLQQKTCIKIDNHDLFEVFCGSHSQLINNAETSEAKLRDSIVIDVTCKVLQAVPFYLKNL